MIKQFSIGDYVKYDNQIWEVIDVNSMNKLQIYYRLSCRSLDISEPIWAIDLQVEETNMSQLYFNI